MMILALSTEILEDTLLTFEQITTSETALALNASRNPERSPRVRELLENLLAKQCPSCSCPSAGAFDVTAIALGN